MTRNDRILWCAALVEALAIVALVLALAQRTDVADAATHPDAGVGAVLPSPPAAAPPAAPDAGPAPSPRSGADGAVSPTPAPAGTTVVFGRVTDTDGAAPDQATITVTRGDGASAERVARVALQRDDAGHFAVPGLAPGPVRLSATATGLREQTAELDLPSGAAAVRRDFRLEKSWELLVRIDTPDGTPLHDRLAALRREDPGLWRLAVEAVATRDAPPAVFPPVSLASIPFGIGRWSGTNDFSPTARRLPARYAGQLELPDHVPLQVSAVLRNAVLATEPVEAGQPEVVLVVPFEAVLATLSTVRLRVVDAGTGAPVADARVSLSDSQSTGPGQPVDPDGRIELTRARPGILQVNVLAVGRADRRFEVELAPGTSIDLGDLPVAAVVEVPLRLSGIDGDAEVSITVTSIDPPPNAALRPRRLSWGRQAVKDVRPLSLAPGRYLVVATASEMRGQAEVDTSVAGETPTVIPMQPAGKLRIVPPADGRAVELTLIDAAGGTAYRRWITWTAAFDVTLPPGSYVARVGGFDGSHTDRNVHVTPDGGELDLR